MQLINHSLCSYPLLVLLITLFISNRPIRPIVDKCVIVLFALIYQCPIVGGVIHECTFVYLIIYECFIADRIRVCVIEDIMGLAA